MVLRCEQHLKINCNSNTSLILWFMIHAHITPHMYNNNTCCCRYVVCVRKVRYKVEERQWQLTDQILKANREIKKMTREVGVNLFDSCVFLHSTHLIWEQEVNKDIVFTLKFKCIKTVQHIKRTKFNIYSRDSRRVTSVNGIFEPFKKYELSVLKDCSLSFERRY